MSDGLLAIVPARSGSKGIPLKVLQPVNGVPLLIHTLHKIRTAGVAERLVVSTEDEYIASVVEAHGHEVIDRPATLASDHIPLDAVIQHATKALNWKGAVACFQPTCPLLSVQTIRMVVDKFHESRRTWMITGYRDPHIFWQYGICRVSRKNRQKLADDLACPLRESGAMQIMTADHAIGAGDPWRGLIEIPADEALDIDTHADLAVARQAYGRRSIGFRVLMSAEHGTGHFWRCLALADALSHHTIEWFWIGEPPQWAKDIIERRGYDFPLGMEPDVLVFDALDMGSEMTYRAKLVVFEAEHENRRADLVVNELYDHGDLHGPRYAVFRPEFLALPPLEPKERGRNVLITFGGTDPAGLNPHYKRVLEGGFNVKVAEHGVSMAKQMREADLVLTSQGRTVGEAVMCSVPVISIAANDRETGHIRIPGVCYLGLHVAVTDMQVRETVDKLMWSKPLRQEMVARARSAVDGRGLQRIVREIECLLEDL